MTKSSTYRHLKRLGIVKRFHKKSIKREVLVEMYVNRLMDVNDIAKELGCSVSTIKDSCSIFLLKRGSDFQRTEEGRSHYSIPHSEGAKEKMSKAKIKLDGQYHCGKWGCGERRYVHRRIAEESVGRRLEINECVHHKDKNKQNNHPENLLILSRESHQALHIVLKRRPDLNQEGWLVENCFDFEEVKNGNYQESPTFARWYGESGGGAALGQD